MHHLLVLWSRRLGGQSVVKMAQPIQHHFLTFFDDVRLLGRILTVVSRSTANALDGPVAVERVKGRNLLSLILGTGDEHRGATHYFAGIDHVWSKEGALVLGHCRGCVEGRLSNSLTLLDQVTRCRLAIIRTIVLLLLRRLLHRLYFLHIRRSNSVNYRR